MTQIYAQRQVVKLLSERGWICMETSKVAAQFFTVIATKDGAILPIYFREPLPGQYVLSNGVVANIRAMLKAGTPVFLVVVTLGYFLCYKATNMNDFEMLKNLSEASMDKYFDPCNNFDEVAKFLTDELPQHLNQEEEYGDDSF